MLGQTSWRIRPYQLLCLTCFWDIQEVAHGTEIQFLSQVFDGAVIILSLAPMVASTVANGPRSPWDAISLIIMLRIWRVKRVIDGEWSKKGQRRWQGGRWPLLSLALLTKSRGRPRGMG